MGGGKTLILVHPGFAAVPHCDGMELCNTITEHGEDNASVARCEMLR